MHAPRIRSRLDPAIAITARDAVIRALRPTAPLLRAQAPCASC